MTLRGLNICEKLFWLLGLQESSNSFPTIPVSRRADSTPLLKAEASGGCRPVTFVAAHVITPYVLTLIIIRLNGKIRIQAAGLRVCCGCVNH